MRPGGRLKIRPPGPIIRAGEDDPARPEGQHSGRPDLQPEPPLRSTADRIRQAVSFELIGILLVTPLFAWAFDHRMGEMGIVVVLGATAATIWNYVFNLAFDHLLEWRRGDVRKTVPLRVVHAVLFEATLLVLLLPLFAWWLDVSLRAALLMEVSFAAFYVVYAFVFTRVYDTLFPPQRGRRTSA